MKTILRYSKTALLACFQLYHFVLLIFIVLRFIRVDGWLSNLFNTFALWAVIPVLLTTPLAFLLRGRRTTLLGLGALVSSGVIFLPLYAPLPQPEVSKNAPLLKIVAYNFLGWNRLAETSVAWIKSQDADVIILEEIGSQRAIDALEPLRETYPYEAFVKNDNRILSKYPFLEDAGVNFGSDQSKSNALRVVIEPFGEPIAIYGVHIWLPSGGKSNIPFISSAVMPFDMMLSYNETERNADLRTLLEQLKTEPYPHIVAGDFNMNNSSLIYQEVDAQMDDAFRQVGRGLGMTWPVGSALGRLGQFLPALLRIDYVWYSDAFVATSAEVGQAIGSDHYPIVVKLAVRDS